MAGLIFTNLGRVPKVGADREEERLAVRRRPRRPPAIYRVKVARDPEWTRAEEEAE